MTNPRLSPLGLLLVLSCGTPASDEPELDGNSTGPSSGAVTEGSASPTETLESDGAGEADGDSGASTGSAVPDIEPGVRVGPVALDARWESLEAELGEPDQSLRFGNLAFVTFNGPGLEVLFASPAGPSLAPSSRVLSVGALFSSAYRGMASPGDPREAVEQALGVPDEVIGDVAYYVSGISVRYEEDVADIVAVFSPYTIRTSPPEMAHYEP